MALVGSCLYQPVGQSQAYHQLTQGLDDLGDGGGRHVPVALSIAPEGGQTAHADDRRSQGADAGGSLVVVHQGGQLCRAKGHDEEGQHAQGKKQGQGQPEHPAHLVLPSGGVGLADQLGHGHGQARGGDGEQHGVDVVGVSEVGAALLPDDVDQRDLVEHADEFDHHDTHGQDGGSAEEGVLFFRPGHPAGCMTLLGHSLGPPCILESQAALPPG